MAADLDCHMAVLGCDCRKLAFITVRSIRQRRMPIVVVSANMIFSNVSRVIITDYIQLVSRAVFLHIDRDVMDISCA